MASAVSPTGAVLAGRHGARTLSLAAAAADPAAHAALAANWTAHERACADVGRDADRTGMCLTYPPEEHIEVLIRPGLAGAGVGVSSV
ncbi:hypothetical protein [Streptomyces virginiae]|uniref:hypothetical protein n=1 Tax=Streptomyces virginiae TaxID=1961 RepID=UPI000523FC9D|nr:hypothetical protein [Streptomyces virginiae]